MAPLRLIRPILVGSGKTNDFLNIICPKLNAVKAQKNRLFLTSLALYNGKVWADLIDCVDAKQLQPRILKQVKKRSSVFSDTWGGYTEIASKGGIKQSRLHFYMSENTSGDITIDIYI